ncbi:MULTISPECIES: dethiobiotin synthase [unclassified Carboxylicivirga]|uniref:dethiobiotin synthase n=1 Tax=Carboxylicivirga TaxID=1628153 RepID=UPI003D3254EC
MSTYFITAIDTDAGKTVVTGLLAKYIKALRRDVITMKLSQTGCEKLSDDIVVHRQIMRVELSEDDKSGLTCPYLFPFPASPHLAAAMENKRISEKVLMNALEALEMKHEHVLVEGLGGLMVPINDELLVADFIQKYNFPVILVTSGRLGSINHTLLTLEALKARNIPVYGVIYNHYPLTASEITADSALVIKSYLQGYYPAALWGEVPVMEGDFCNSNALLKEAWFQ